MIARLQNKKENLKFVVRAKNEQVFVGKVGLAVGVQFAEKYDSKDQATGVRNLAIHPEDWEVEQIVVC